MVLEADKIIVTDGDPVDNTQPMKSSISIESVVTSDVSLQRLYVKAGDDLKTIIEAISDSSIIKPYVVNVSAGVYSIGDNSITIPAYVTIQGTGSVILNYTGNTTKTAFSMSGGTSLKGITIQNHLSSLYSVSIIGTGSYVLDDIVFLNCSRCVNVNNAAVSVTIRGITLLPFASPMVDGVKVDGGKVTVSDITVGGAQTLTNALWADSADAIVHFRHFLSVSSTGIINALYASNGASIEGDTYDIHNATRGAYVLSGANVRIGTGAIEGCDYGIYVEGTDSTLGGYGLVISNSIINNVYAGANAILYGTGRSNSSNFFIDPDASMLVSFLDTFEGDESLAISAELHVGTPQHGRESCFGEGDSYVNGMKVFTFDGTSTYTDVTVAASSASGSTLTFPNLNANTAIYVGSDVLLPTADYHKFFGIKMFTTVAQVGGTIVAEYYNGSWTEFATMTTESDGDFYRKADQLFAVAAGTYQVRFNPEITTDWIKNNDPSHANRYWVRFRITSTLATAPVFQQIKCHSNRSEVNADGYDEMMGTARPYVTISVPWSTFQDSASKLGDQDLYASTNCNTGFKKNTFADDGDSIGTVFTIPNWVDTSAPIKVRVILVSAYTGTLQMKAFLNSSIDGDTISTSDPVSTTGEISVTESQPVVTGEQITYIFSLDISDKGVQSSGGIADTLWLNVEADALNGGTIYGMVFDIGFLSWRTGQHV